MHCVNDDHDTATVFVVDPDPKTGPAIQEVLNGSSVSCEVFRSGRDFFAAFSTTEPGCVVLEQRMPDMSGLQVQRRLSASGCSIPLVFLTTCADVSTAVELMRGGAVHVLEKPSRPIELLTAIQEGLALDRERRQIKQQQTTRNDLIAALTRKEREIFELIGRGRSVKAMASELDLSARAVEMRRHNLMKKLGVGSSLDLMRFAVSAQNEAPVPCFAGR
jgi:two-component system, LuxR family, response regulator FixJ